MAIENSEIKELAHRLWEDRGGGHGGHEQDWQDAEAQFRRESTRGATPQGDQLLRESVPASDAPSSPLPDVASANAVENSAAAKAADKTKRR